MRGKATKTRGNGTGSGITPAYAGKRAGPAASRVRSWDHPRVCGEKLDHLLVDVVGEGSPPRMRGKGVVQRVCAESGGITPAYAGKSYW